MPTNRGMQCRTAVMSADVRRSQSVSAARRVKREPHDDRAAADGDRVKTETCGAIRSRRATSAPARRRTRRPHGRYEAERLSARVGRPAQSNGRGQLSCRRRRFMQDVVGGLARRTVAGPHGASRNATTASSPGESRAHSRPGVFDVLALMCVGARGKSSSRGATVARSDREPARRDPEIRPTGVEAAAAAAVAAAPGGEADPPRCQCQHPERHRSDPTLGLPPATKLQLGDAAEAEGWMMRTRVR
jgi:hypothetical protein